MNKEEYYLKQIEKINLERISTLKSKNYTIGNNLTKAMYLMSHGKIFQLFKLILRTKKWSKLIFLNPSSNNCSFRSINKHCKIAVYTSVIGNYDKICEEPFKSKYCDYFIISDKKLSLHNWNYIDINEYYYNDDKTFLNRYAKLNPHVFFKDYDYSIYIDGNIDVVSDISCFVNQISSSTGIALHKHSARNCIYQEAKLCKLLKKGNLDNISRLLQKFRIDGFPEEFGLFECNVIVVDLKNKKSKEFLEEWWRYFVKYDCKRDQFFPPYILWKNHMKIDDIGYLGENAYLNSKLFYRPHNN